MIKTIGIIGAGLAGLSCARIYKAFGYDVTVFEKEADLGGVWSASRRYPGLCTQDSKTAFHLPDYPMPDDYPEWPSGQQMQEYLQSYSDHFDLTKHIHLNHKVINAQYDEQQSSWQVTAQKTTGDHAETTQPFDFLMVCNGIYSAPSIPQYSGAQVFKDNGGTICHTCEFTDTVAAKDKHVVVIGYGKSSCDVANAIADDAKSTTVVARQLIWKVPRMVATVLNNKNLFATRLSEALFPYIRLQGADKFFQGIGTPLRKLLLGTLSFVISKQLRLKKLGLLPKLSLAQIANSSISQVSEGFYGKVARNELTVKRDNEIVSLSKGEATLANGDVIPADFIICGTGWKQKCPFFDDAFMDKITDEKGNFLLYRNLLPIGAPNIAFNGYNSALFNQLGFQMGALWLASYLKGGIKLPSIDDQKKSVTDRLAWLAERTEGKHSKGASLIPFSLHYSDELLKDMSMPLSSKVCLKQWFVSVDPSDYAHVLPELQKKYNVEGLVG